MPAFMYEVDEVDRTVNIEFAADAEEAALQIGCDADAMRHVPQFDQYEPQGEVYPVQWQEQGYRVACEHCEHMVDTDICYECDGNYPHEDDPDKAAIADYDHGVVNDGKRVYCDRVCMERHHREVEERKQKRAANGQNQ